MILIVLSVFIFAFAILLSGRHIKNNYSFLSILPISLFIYFVTFLSEIQKGAFIEAQILWVPALDVNLNFRLDGLSMLFCLLITGIGSLIYIYAAAYLKGHQHLNRFYCYLSLFLGSMLGLVLSDNTMLLFIFWELTSITSFFLIGFNNEERESRKSALIALSVTGGGGFLLLAGLIMLGYIAESNVISLMISSGDLISKHSSYFLILTFIIMGAVTKSAQFPFHFWLPGAMKAPTPISAYLHSATMVKAGIYLLIRFGPIMGEDKFWNYTLITIGTITMVYAAIHSVFRMDLKEILAYSTISALGLIVMLIGIGTETSLLAAFVFIVVHAFYKASLFLITGVIDHTFNTRDITRLKGLKQNMKPLALAGLLSALSSAGVPLTFGFIGKDLIYEATLGSDLAIFLTSVAIITNVLLFYAGFAAGFKPFFGTLPKELLHIKKPALSLILPPLFLSVAGLFFGLFPSVIDNTIINTVVTSQFGRTLYPALKIWHGFNLILLLSFLTLICGLVFYIIYKPSLNKLHFLHRFGNLSPLGISVFLWKNFKSASLIYTRTLQNGYLRTYISRIIIFITLLIGYKLFSGVNLYINYSQISEITIYEGLVFCIMTIAILKTVTTSSRLAAIACLSVIGFCMCLFFVFYSAPDLAMTQFAIDTLTVILFVLVLLKLPPFLNITAGRKRLRDAIFSIGFGLLIAIIALEVLNEPVNKEISQFYGENAYKVAKGKNIVNVILVDFRGLDTMIEITVLTIAAIGVYSLLKLKVKSSEKE